MNIDDVLASLREQIGILAQEKAILFAQVKELQRKAAEKEQPDE